MRVLLVLLLVGCSGVVRPQADGGPLPLGDAGLVADAGVDAAAPDAFALLEDAGADAPELADAGVDAQADDAAIARADGADSAPGALVDHAAVCAQVHAAFDATHCPESFYSCPLFGTPQQWQVDRCASAVQQYYDNPDLDPGALGPCYRVDYLLRHGGTECNP